jgi:hypothetical protein
MPWPPDISRGCRDFRHSLSLQMVSELLNMSSELATASKVVFRQGTTSNTTHEVTEVPHEVAEVSHKASVSSTRPLGIFKAFKRVPQPLKLSFLTSFCWLKCSVNCGLAYRHFTRSKRMINFTLKRQRKVVSHNRILFLLCGLVFFYGAAVAYIISAFCIPTPSSDINRRTSVDEWPSFIFNAYRKRNSLDKSFRSNKLSICSFRHVRM